jgi:5-methyltetrahydrofolate--homocysteine methyltransferase
VHAGFLEVGCDVIETNSFNGTPVDFAEYDIADKAYDMNVLAARLPNASLQISELPQNHAGLQAPWARAENFRLSVIYRSRIYATPTAYK